MPYRSALCVAALKIVAGGNQPALGFFQGAIQTTQVHAFNGARQQLRPRHDLKFWLACFVIARLDVVGPRYPPIGGIAGAWLATDVAGEGFSPHGFRSLRSPTAIVFSIPQRFA